MFSWPLPELLIIFIASGIVVLDTTAVGQILLSQPLISCTLLGFYLDDVNTGLYIGLLMELLWLKLVPIGGAMFYEGNIGSFVAAGVAVLVMRSFPDKSGIVVFIALIYGFLVSYAGGQATILRRKLTQKIVNKCLTKAHQGNIRAVTYGHVGSILLTFAGGGLFGSIAILIGIRIIPLTTEKIPDTWNNFADLGLMAIWGTAIGLVFSMFWEKQKAWAVALGVFAGILGSFLLK